MSSPKEKKLNYTFTLLKSFFCSFVFSANIHTPVNAVVRAFMLTQASTAGTEAPFRALGQLPSTTLGFWVYWRELLSIPLYSKRGY